MARARREIPGQTCFRLLILHALNISQLTFRTDRERIQPPLDLFQDRLHRLVRAHAFWSAKLVMVMLNSAIGTSLAERNFHLENHDF